MRERRPDGLGSLRRLAFAGLWQGGLVGTLVGLALAAVVGLSGSGDPYGNGEVVGGGAFAPRPAWQERFTDLAVLAFAGVAYGLPTGAGVGVLLGASAGVVFAVAHAAAGRDVAALLAVLLPLPGAALAVTTVVGPSTGLLLTAGAVGCVAVLPLAYAVRREHARWAPPDPWATPYPRPRA